MRFPDSIECGEVIKTSRAINAHRVVASRNKYKTIQPLSVNSRLYCWMRYGGEVCGGRLDRYREGMLYCDRCGQNYMSISESASPRPSDLRPV